jgi:ATP-dependent Lon protease
MLQQDPLIRLPLLPLRDVVVYPHSKTSLFVGRDKSIAALNEAMSKDKKILVVTQKISTEDDPQANALHVYGTLSNIVQMLKLPDGTAKVLIEGTERIKIIEIEDANGYFTASYEKYSSLKLQDQGS